MKLEMIIQTNRGINISRYLNISDYSNFFDLVFNGDLLMIINKVELSFPIIKAVKKQKLNIVLFVNNTPYRVSPIEVNYDIFQSDKIVMAKGKMKFIVDKKLKP